MSGRSLLRLPCAHQITNVSARDDSQPNTVMHAAHGRHIDILTKVAKQCLQGSSLELMQCPLTLYARYSDRRQPNCASRAFWHLQAGLGHTLGRLGGRARGGLGRRGACHALGLLGRLRRRCRLRLARPLGAHLRPPKSPFCVMLQAYFLAHSASQGAGRHHLTDGSADYTERCKAYRDSHWKLLTCSPPGSAEHCKHPNTKESGGHRHCMIEFVYMRLGRSLERAWT